MAEANRKFDGEVVIVVDKDTWMDDGIKAIINSRTTDRSHILSAKNLAQTLAARLEVVDLMKQGASSCDLRRVTSLANYLETTLPLGVPSELVQLIFEGRLQMAFLLSSEGGDKQVRNIFMDMMDVVAGRGGETQAYVTDLAYSSAFDNMKHVDRAFVLDESLIGWHRTLDADTEKVIAETAENDRAELMEFICKAKQPYRQKFMDRIMRARNNPEKPDESVYFLGAELADAGCVEKNCVDITSMRKFFGSQYWSALNPLVQKFWKKPHFLDQYNAR